MKKSLVLAGAALMAGLVFADKPEAKGANPPPPPNAGERHQMRPPVDMNGPQNLSVVIDVSGAITGARFDQLLKNAVDQVAKLDDRSIVSVVAFDNRAKVIVEAAPLTDKAGVIEQIKALKPKGDGAKFAGIAKAAEEVRKNADKNLPNNIMIVSNGPGNIGPNGNEEMRRFFESMRKEKIHVMGAGRFGAHASREGMQRHPGEGEHPQMKRGEGERPQVKRGEGERPQMKRGEGDRPQVKRGEGERPQAKRGEGDRPQMKRGEGDRPQAKRGEGERPQAKRGEGERPQVKRGDRENRKEKADKKRQRKDGDQGDKKDAPEAKAE